MKTEPYQIIKKYRGQYQVLDENGSNITLSYVSHYRAQQIVLEHKLQDKAMIDPRVLKAAEIMTGKSGDNLKKWLYEVLIRFDKDELKQLNKRPKNLEDLYNGSIKRMEKSLSRQPIGESEKTPASDRQKLTAAAAPLVEYLKENHHPGSSIIVNHLGVMVLEGVKNISEIFKSLEANSKAG